MDASLSTPEGMEITSRITRERICEKLGLPLGISNKALAGFVMLKYELDGITPSLRDFLIEIFDKTN